MSVDVHSSNDTEVAPLVVKLITTHCQPLEWNSLLHSSTNAPRRAKDQMITPDAFVAPPFDET